MQNKYRLPAHVKPERYQIMLKPDLENFIFEGEETIYLILDKPAKKITLHCVELEVECEGAKVAYDKKQETAKLSFQKPIPAGKHQLKIKFRGILNDKMRGFYRSRYGDKHLAVTQFESTDARRAFPCFDEPAQKAIFDVTLMVPGHTTAISNTIESSVREHESGFKIVEFLPTPKMSTYLLAFIVGEFEYIEGRTSKSSLRKQGSNNRNDLMDSRMRGNDKGILVRVFTTPGKVMQAKFALDVAVKVLEFYENYFDIAYPLPVLDLIAIPDFAAGAMENWGAITYRESTLLIDKEKSSAANKQWVALVIAHELAHQWFGNLVTMEWWTHLWLNEGFASFIEYLAIDHIFPKWDIWTQFISREMAEAYQLDSLKNTHPIEIEVGHPAEIIEIFDEVSYSKGASVLRMLWQYLGAETFRKGLRHYLKRHSYANAKTEDLWKALEEISGKPVAKVMKNWTSKPGHPLIRVQATGNRLQLAQSRFFSSPISRQQSKDNTIWNIPLDGLLMDKKSITIPNKNKKFNLGETSFVRIDYPKNYLGKLKNLSAVDRLGLIRDSFDLAESGDSPTTLALELAQSYVDEEDYTVWSQLTGHLNKLDNLLDDDEIFKKYGREVYGKIANKMGWEKKQGEKHTDVLLRSMALYQLGSFGDDETISKAFDLFHSSTPRHPERLAKDLLDSSPPKAVQNDNGIVKIDPDLRGVVYNLVAENGEEKEFNALIKMYKEEEHQQEKDRIGRSLGLFKEKKLLKKTLEFAISKHIRFQNTLGIITSVWGNPAGRYLAWEFVKKNWKLLKDRYAGGHYFTRVFEPMGDFTKISDANEIERFVAKNPVPEAKRTIAQALERIYSNVEWLKRDKNKINSFLKKSFQ